jgi:hypothetical protein
MILPSTRTAEREIEQADESVTRLEHSAEQLNALANKVSDKEQIAFIDALRSSHTGRHKQSDEAKKAEGLADATGAAQKDLEDDILQMFTKMKDGQPVYPQELAEKLEKSFQKLSDFIIYHIETEFFKSGAFSNVAAHINHRKQMFKEIARIMAGNSAIKTYAEMLATTRYDDLLKVLTIINRLSEEHKQKMTNIYTLTEQLEMIRGLNVEEGPGLIARIFGAKKKEEKKVSFTLSENDKRKIPVLQNMLNNLHSTTIVAIRGRLREFERERQQVSQDEAEIISKLRRAPRTNIRQYARAA